MKKGCKTYWRLVFCIVLLFVGVLNADAETANLTEVEHQWVSNHPILRVANETDWPPFDFSVGGKPRGYSIDLIELIGKKTGLRFEFINGFSWSELLAKFKAGDIDIMPAIYVDEERKSYISFTDGYFLQPSVIVVKKDRTDIKNLSDLDGKHLAVIQDHNITKKLAREHPNIQQVPVKGVVEAIKAVSLGEVDAFIESIGVVSVTIEEHFIPNIKIVRGKNLKSIEYPELHMGVSIDNIILRDILNKGLKALSREEITSLRQKWMPLEFDNTPTETKSSYQWVIISGGVLLLIIMIVSILCLWRFRSDKKMILILLILLLFGLVCAEFAAMKIYISKNEAISHAKLVRMESLKLVDHLRQTTDDLTRMASLFAITGDARFEAYFNRILEIRNGDAPRPQDYSNVYWDYVIATGRDPRSNEAPISIEALMLQNHFDNEEFNLLKSAKTKSDTLAELERHAINAVKGLFADEAGAYNKKGAPDFELAQKLLHSKDYYKAKADIMAVIDSVSLHVNKRTNQAIDQLNMEARELILIAYLIGFGCLFMVGLLLLLAVKWISSSSKKNVEDMDDDEKEEGKTLKRFILSSLIKSWPLLLTFLLVAFLITGLSWRNMVHLVDHERDTLKESLESVLQMTANATQNWFQEREQEIRIWADSPKIGKIFKQLSNADSIAAESNDETLNLQYQSNLLTALKRLIVEQGYLGYLIVNARGKILGSDRNLLIGSHLESPEEQSFLKQAMAGPNYSAMSLPNIWMKKGSSLENKAVMMSGALIRTIEDSESGVLILLIDPEEEFTEILQAGRIGTSGESYAFNRQGQLISESRFDNNLKEIGLIGPTQRGILNIAIRDPGGNMVEGFVPKVGHDQQELTLMAAKALQGQPGLNLDGYNDYRGVPVIGAWIWNEPFGFGLTTEIDVAEAYTSIKSIKRQTVSSILISLGLLLIMTAIFVWGRIRTSMANDKLRISERRISEQLSYQSALLGAVEVAEEKSRLLLESVGDGIFGVGNDGLVNFINSAGLQMLGISSQDVIGKEIHPIIHHTKSDGSTYPVDECPMYQSFTRGETNHIHDEVLWRKDGSSFPVEYSSVPIKKEKEIIGSVVIFRDITLRKQNEEELKKLSMAVEQSMVSVVITNPKGSIEYVNSAFTKITGYGSEEVVGQNPRLLNAGILTKEFYKKLWKTIKRGAVWRGEFANKKKNGDIFWEQASISPLRNDKDQITHFVAVKEDITDRKQAEEALRENEEMLSKITSSALSAIIMVSSETGEISFWNQAAENIFGWEAREVMGKKLHELIVPERYRDQHLEGLKQFRHNGEGSLIGRSTEISAVNKGGVEFPVELNLSAVKLNDKWNAIGLITDITDRKQVERDLKDAKAAAEVATQAKGDFLANMSHEIRTPMNAIIGMSHLCLGTDLQPRQQDYIEKVYQSAQSLLGIINDILDFSKIEAGKLEMESIPFRLDDVLENISNLIAIKAQEKGLELLFDAHPAVPGALIGDPLRLGQILLNLAGNALKFTEEGEIVIRTELIRITDDEVEIQFAVKDSGIGMTSKQVDKLFQSFSQADTSTTRKYGGTGLGLTISKRLTELMKGEIRVESEPEKGSAFIFTAVFGRALDMEKTIENERPADLEKLKVLVVDDVESARDMLKATLESFSFRVTCVDSGSAALEMLDAAPLDDPFQLVLMDWIMPGMDGIETSKRIKQHSALMNIPTIIMVTAYGREEVMQQASNAGLEGFLIKPMTPSTLLDTIMQVFGNKGGFRKGIGSDKDWEIKTVEALQGCHVLVAEDNKINQQVAQELLTQAGLTVTIANNGKEALERVSKESFDAVLMDMQMPEMDGFEATKAIRSKPKFKDLPIIAMTANAMAGDREKCLDAGMVDHIPKPIDPDLLFKTLARWVTPGNDQIGVENRKQPETDPTADSLPTHLVGIDTEKGLKNVGGNRILYQKLLVDFYQDHHDDFNGIGKAIKEGHLDIAQRMTHTIKGVAGTIGASALYAKAEQLDTALKNLKSDRYGELLADMAQSMTDVMKSLKDLASQKVLQEEKTDATSTAPIDADFVLNTLDELGTLFEEMDPDAVDKVYLLNEQLKESHHAALFGKLTKQVEELEYEDASETLSLLAQAIRGSQGKEL